MLPCANLIFSYGAFSFPLEYSLPTFFITNRLWVFSNVSIKICPLSNLMNFDLISRIRRKIKMDVRGRRKTIKQTLDKF